MKYTIYKQSATNYYPFWENQELKRLLRELWAKYQRQQKTIVGLFTQKVGRGLWLWNETMIGNGKNRLRIKFIIANSMGCVSLLLYRIPSMMLLRVYQRKHIVTQKPVGKAVQNVSANPIMVIEEFTLRVVRNTKKGWMEPKLLMLWV